MNRTEHKGTGTRDTIPFFQEAVLAEPEFSVSDSFVATIWRRARAASGEVAREVTSEVGRLLKVFDGEHGRQELQERLVLKGEENFRTLYLPRYYAR